MQDYFIENIGHILALSLFFDFSLREGQHLLISVLAIPHCCCCPDTANQSHSTSSNKGQMIKFFTPPHALNDLS